MSTEPLAARAPVREDSPRFADLGVHPSIVRALADVGITRTFAIQEMALPIAMAGQDLIGQARTGTGKTLGFGVPLLERTATGSDQDTDSRPQALVVVPTRELAVQVTRDIAAAGRYLRARCVAIYGGRAYEPQVTALRKGVDIVVGTPGRLLDLAQQGHLNLSRVASLVLDEADEMLDLGFLPDIERILAMVPEERQTMLFSATMPGPIVALARRFMRQPTQVRAQATDEHSSLPPVRQFAYRAHAMDKVEMLARILQSRERGLTMLFCRTKRTAAKVAEDLEQRGFAAAAVHGDLGQGARERALRAFRAGKIDVLVATDVAARGIDVEAVTHVINHQCPEDEKVYLHRIGRTARAGATGTAITLVDWDDLARWKMVCDTLDLPLHEPPETYSTSEHLHVDLDIPTGVTGMLPRAQRVRAGLAAEDVEDIGETGVGRGRLRPRRPGRRTERAGGTRASEATAGDEPRPTGSGDHGDHGGRGNRKRRRTRRGRPVEAGRPAGPVAEAAGQPAAGATEDGSGPRRAPVRTRRRRRRGAGSGNGTSGTADNGGNAGSLSAE
ncbi:MAG TPA: DEAD/DEAH box helicase [Mycobacteriales bacterium]|nr:DEAD/DEAH box helicase [Mycobacteriales bacterium]